MAVFRLSLALGIPDPYMLENRIKARLMADWLAFDDLEPIGNRLTNQLLATQAAIISNAFFKLDEPLQPNDFLPGKTGQVQRDPKQKAREVYGKFKAWAMVHRQEVQ